ncbi:MAG: antibiotic biosynthesis monooxygenase [Amaricoccus sp.]
MGDGPAERRKYIIGWLTCRTGRRDELMALAVPYAAACRQEEGCLFFEMNPSVHAPDVVSIAECFASREAHAAHLETERFRGFWARLHALCIEGRFENIFPAAVEPDSADFAGETHAHSKA